MVTVVNSDILKLMGSRVQGQRKVAEKDQRLFNWVVCPKIVSRKVHSAENCKAWIKSRSQVLQDHDAPRKNSGKNGSIAGGHAKMQFRGLQDSRIERKTKP